MSTSLLGAHRGLGAVVHRMYRLAMVLPATDGSRGLISNTDKQLLDEPCAKRFVRSFGVLIDNASPSNDQNTPLCALVVNCVRLLRNAKSAMQLFTAPTCMICVHLGQGSGTCTRSHRQQ
eukprot:m.437692 g.437692  ORF g.437692 m.437692 type:complete len:120 (-) comp21438_c0_seq2:566-925(-)